MSAPGKSSIQVLAAAVFLAMLLSASGPARSAEVVAVRQADGLPSDWITSLAAGEDALWAGTPAGLARIAPDGRVLEVRKVRDGLPSDAVTSVAVLGEKVFVGTKDGIGVYDGRSWETLKGVQKVALKNVTLRADPSAGRLWGCAIHLNGGLFLFDGGKWAYAGGRGRGPLNHIMAFAFQDGVVWLGSSNSGVYRLTDTEFRYFRSADGLPSSTIQALEVFEGSVWAGTADGAARYEGGRWKAFIGADGFPLRAVFSMAASPSALYLGGREGLARYRFGKFERFSIEGFPLGRVNALQHYRGALYVGTSSGLFIVKGW